MTYSTRNPQQVLVQHIGLTIDIYPSQDSSVGSISAWFRGGPGFKSWQGREFFSEKNYMIQNTPISK